MTPEAHAPVEEDTRPEVSPSFPVVGVGASAGGLEAFTRLLKALPEDTGMAFVFIQHLAPSHESALAEILSRATSLPVTEVSDEPEIEPNRVYVIPPNRDMAIVRGHLKLLAREEKPHHPIDRFFRSLAENQRHMAIGVVLSGTATDGTLGLEEIKAEGGITFAQDDTAQYEGMPLSAVASGSVDFVLPPEEIAREIARIATHPFVAPVAADTEEATRGVALAKSDLVPILQVLRSATDVDFAQYKANTLVRRITRRMVLLKKEGLREYAQFLLDNRAEVEALYQDILINVTSFFRDPEMFEALKARVIPVLLEGRSPRDPLRVWVLGCSTGEEAYSLAMVLSEAMESSNGRAALQVFATDLNLTAVERARTGVYPKERMENVSRERLRRFFVEADGNFRVSKPIRDVCVFSRHNVMADPPFSRMDLVSCRNLLIYLDPPLQQRIIPILHYALKPTGHLILGASETVGQFRDLFGIEDGKHKIFVKKPGSGRPILLFPRVGGSDQARRREGGGASSVAPAFGTPDLQKEADRLLLAFAPAAVLVDGNFQILQFRGNTEPYLVPAQGKASFAVLKMVRPGLLVPLRALLQRARKENEPVLEERVQVRLNDELLEVDVKVCPVKVPGALESGFLVLFQDSPTGGPRGKTKNRKPRPDTKAEKESAAADLLRIEHELANTREYMQALCDQHDAAVEELQSANEEVQSANEELQSINEELETSKEEIQSSNEELTTVNDELNSRNLELGLLNSDLTNLITSVQVAIVIVGRDLRIRRFSPMAEKLLSIIAADVGRSIGDIRMKIDVPDMESLLAEVIDTVTPKEREVQAKDGRWYSLRLRPYLTLESKIDGAVLIMTDVDAIRNAREYAVTIVDTMRDPILILDDDLRVRSGNRAFYEHFRVVRGETEGRLVYELGNGQWDIRELRQLLADVLPGTSKVEEFVVEHEFEHIGRRMMRLNSRKLVVPGEGRESILLAFEDITERMRAQAEHEQLDRALHERADDLDAANRDKADFIAVLSHELRTPLNAISGWTEILRRGVTSDEERDKALEVIARNSRIQAQLISDLLDVQRISGGKLSLDLRSVDMGSEVEAAIDSARPAAQEKRIRLASEVDPAPAFVLGDSARIQQVLGNLLSNAIKFTPEGGEIRVALRHADTRAEVSVSDSGQGISSVALPRIFERFRQAEPLASRGARGLGLGLAVTKQLVELHGGDVSARSPGKGKGATFTVSLPLVSEARAAIAHEEGPSASPAVLSGLTVLVVDDEADAREPMRRVLEEHGAAVLAVRSADEALDAIQRQLPDVLLSDIGMPGHHGYYLIRAIRALPAGRGGRIPAIALTAFGTADERERATREGYTTHLAKPVKLAELVAAIVALTPPREQPA